MLFDSDCIVYSIESVAICCLQYKLNLFKIVSYTKGDENQQKSFVFHGYFKICDTLRTWSVIYASSPSKDMTCSMHTLLFPNFKSNDKLIEKVFPIPCEERAFRTICEKNNNYFIKFV